MEYWRQDNESYTNEGGLALNIKKKIALIGLAVAVILLAAFSGVQIYKFGYESGFDSGHAGWYNKGYKEGREDGYQNGFEKGFEHAKTELSTQLSAEEAVTTEQDVDEYEEEESKETVPTEYSFVLNKNSKRFHKPDCKSTSNMKEENKEYYSGTREELIQKGYQPCGSCKP